MDILKKNQRPTQTNKIHQDTQEM